MAGIYDKARQKILLVIFLVPLLSYVLGCGQPYQEAMDNQSESSQTLKGSPPTSIAFVRDGNIWIAAEDGSLQRQLTSMPSEDLDSLDPWSAPYSSRFGGLSFSNDGKKLAAWMREGSISQPSNWKEDSIEIVLIDINTSENLVLVDLKNALSNELDMRPWYGNLCWSPQDDSLYFTAINNQAKGSDVTKYDLANKTAELVVEDAESPSLSADGKTLSCVRGIDIVDKDLETGEEKTTEADCRDIVYSIAANAVAHTSQKGSPDQDVDATNTDSDKYFRYVDGLTSVMSHPSFSPDANRIIFCMTGALCENRVENGQNISKIVGSESALYIGVVGDYEEGGYPPYNIQEWGSGLYPAWSPR